MSKELISLMREVQSNLTIGKKTKTILNAEYLCRMLEDAVSKKSGPFYNRGPTDIYIKENFPQFDAWITSVGDMLFKDDEFDEFNTGFDPWYAGRIACYVQGVSYDSEDVKPCDFGQWKSDRIDEFIKELLDDTNV